MNEKKLKVYLNDHLAASVAGIQMTKHCLRNSTDLSLSQFLSDFLSQVTEEQKLLKQIIVQLGASQFYPKKMVAWLFEKMAHIKLNYLRSNKEPSRLLELEGLLAGVHAKLDLWRVLEHALRLDPLFSKYSFRFLVERVEKQLSAIEEHCLKAAARAFEFKSTEK